MDISKFLAKVIGIYFVIVSIALLCNMQQFTAYVSSLITDVPVMFVTGFFTLILGILLLVGHQVWEWNWRVIITIVGWLTFVKGASIIFYPQFIDRISMSFVQNTNFAYIAAIVDLILGLILCYFGFKRA